MDGYSISCHRGPARLVHSDWTRLVANRFGPAMGHLQQCGYSTGRFRWPPHHSGEGRGIQGYSHGCNALRFDRVKATRSCLGWLLTWSLAETALQVVRGSRIAICALSVLLSIYGVSARVLSPLIAALSLLRSPCAHFPRHRFCQPPPQCRSPA